MNLVNTPSATASAPQVTAPAPAPHAAHAAAPSGEDRTFARLLAARQRDAQGEAARSARPPHETEAGESAAQQARDSRDAAARSAQANKRNSVKTPERSARPAGEADKNKAQAEAAPAQGDKPAAAKDDDRPAMPAEPALAELIAGLNRPLAAGPALAPGDTGGQAIDGTAKPAAGKGKALGALDARDAASSRSRDAQAVELTPAIDKADAGRDIVDAVAAPGKNDARVEAGSPVQAPAAHSLAALQSTPRLDSAAAPVDVAMSTPATAPEFTQALGVQVSMLARDGVQHAELSLNPADMGPISVQIALHGTQAQVDFGVDSSATRHIIESGLPELAAALRDAGFTLSGGGVSQHSRRQDDSDGRARQDAGGRRIGGASDVSGPAARRTSVRLPQGAVDLYA